MATNGSAEQTFAPVLEALATLQSKADQSKKAQAHEYLEAFQKAPEAWSPTFAMLQSPTATTEAKLFAATTMKGKIIYDLHQVPREQLVPMRDSLITLLASYSAGPRPLRTQLCVCLANLAIQMTEWHNVIQDILATMGNDQSNIPCILEFLHVLPEEVTEGRKINLSEDELNQRTTELLTDNSEKVLELLTQYSQSSEAAAKNPQLLECVTSWMREVAMNDIVNSPLLDTVVNGMNNDESFDAAVECLSAIFRETRDVDESKSTIEKIYPRLIALRPRIAVAVENEDTEQLKGLTRVFAEAGEAWVILMARMPEAFRGLCEAVLECAARDKERDAISSTFNFWYELKQYLTLEKYIEARVQYADIFSTLVDIMVVHLQFPKPESGNENDLFDGDREQEDKFREFRHLMGDVLKDCCEVIGVTECLTKTYRLIQAWVDKYASQAQNGRIPEWQSLEAPLFSLRAMGRMVPPDESIMLPQLIPLIVQIPDQEKVRFQAVMALGRYTEWTSRHADYLKPQLDFIMAAFQHPSAEVVKAAALSFRFFCDDCAVLMKKEVEQLQIFYAGVLDRLPNASKEEITEGVAAVVAAQDIEDVYRVLKLYCNPVMERLMQLAEAANDDQSKLAVADQIQLITVFVQKVQPPIYDLAQPNPAVQYCQEIFPILAKIAASFTSSIPILERVCRCWRYMVLSYRSSISPLLPQLASVLADGFSASRQGCFLWATDAIVREFSEGAENVDVNTTNAIFDFCEAQTKNFLQALSDLAPEELPDVIEDFFRLQTDVLMYYPSKAVASQYMAHILSAAATSLTLLKEEPLIATLHYIRDFLAYGGTHGMPQSSFGNNGPQEPPPEVQNKVKELLSVSGEVLTQRTMTGMMYTFPSDCVPDGSGLMLAMFELLPKQTAEWVNKTISLLPPGSITPQEAQRLMDNINKKIEARENRKIRTILGDFTNSYRRRNVAPREGLGRLEATKFRFAG